MGWQPNINCRMFDRGKCLHQAAPRKLIGCASCILCNPNQNDPRVPRVCTLQVPYDRPECPPIPPIPLVKRHTPPIPPADRAALADYRNRIAELERQNRMLMQRDWLFAEAFAEVKAIADGDKEQTLQQVVEGLIEELPPVVKST